MARRHGMTGRMLAMALAMMMIVTSLPQTALTVYAAEETAVDAADAVGTDVAKEASLEDAAQDTSEYEWGGVDETTPTDGTGNEEPDAGQEETPPAEEEQSPIEDASATEDSEEAIEEDASGAFEDMERPVDERAIISVQPNRLTHKEATLEVRVTEAAYNDDNYVAVFYRKKVTEGTEPEYERFDGEGVDYDYYYEGEDEVYYYYADARRDDLEPETTYEYIAYLTLLNPGTTRPTGDAVIDTYGGTFTTKVFEPLKGVTVEPGIKTAVVKPAVEFDWAYDDNIYFHMEYEKDGEAGSKTTKTFSGCGDEGVYEPDELFVLEGLTPNSTYTYKVTASTSSNPADTSASVQEPIRGTFKTAADTRTMGDVKIDAGIRWAHFTVPYAGGSGQEVTYIALFGKKSTDSAYERWDYKSSWDGELEEYSASGEVELWSDELVPGGASYEYVVVVDNKDISTTYNASADYYCATEPGTFVTLADTRKITGVSHEASYTQAAITVAWNSGTKVDWTTVLVYVREKDTGAFGSVACEDDSFDEVALGTCKLNVTGLTPGKTYEYVAALWDGAASYAPSTYDESTKDKFINASEVKEFTAKAEGRKLGEVKVTPTYTTAAFNVPFSENLEKASTYARVFYRRKGSGEAYTGLSRKSSTDIAGTITFKEDGLTKNTPYEYVVILSDNGSAIDSLTDAQLGLTPGTEEAKAAGILDKYASEFNTAAEKRAIIAPTQDVTFTSAVITTGFSGSYQGDTTYMTLFYREKKETAVSYVKVADLDDNQSKDASYKLQYEFEWLTPGAEYEVAFVLSEDGGITAYPVTDAEKEYVIAEKAFTFKSAAESRKLTKTSASAGYETLRIRTGYEGNLYNDTVHMYAYTKKSSADRYDYQESYPGHFLGYDEDDDPVYEQAMEQDSWDVLISGLEQGEKYDYAIVFSDTNSYALSLTQAELDAMPEGWVVTGKEITTKKANWKVKVTLDDKLSNVGYNVLNVELEGTAPQPADDMIVAYLQVYDKDDVDKKLIDVDDFAMLRYRAGYKGQLIDRELAPGKTYVVSAVTLVAEEEGSGVMIQMLSATPEAPIGEFTTKTAEPQVTIAENYKDVYLNMNSVVPGAAQTIKAAVSPATAVDMLQLACVVAPGKPTDVADITKDCEPNGLSGEVEITINPLKAGETTFQIVSAKDTSAKLAEFTVHVEDYVLAEVPADGPPINIFPPSNTLDLLKGATSPELAVYSSTDDGYVRVDGTPELYTGRNLVSWANNKLTAVNAGEGIVLFKVGNYIVPLDVVVQLMSKDFFINALKSADCPAIITAGPTKAGLTATVAAGKRYMIDGYFSPLNVAISDVPEALTFSSDNDDVTVTNDGVIRTASKSTAYTATITVKANSAALPDASTDGTKITLNVKPIPEVPYVSGTVLSNVVSTLGDIKLSDGWSWDDGAATPLFTSYAYGDDGVRSFTMSHNGLDGKYYPLSGQTARLGIITMTDMDVEMYPVDDIENSLEYNNYVVELDRNSRAVLGFDLSTTCINVMDDEELDPGDLEDYPYLYNMLIDESRYQYRLECTDSNKADVQIVEGRNAFARKVTFTKAGTYHFTATVLSKSGKTILSKKYTLKAVDAASQIDLIYVKAATYNDTSKASVIGELKTGGTDTYGNTIYTGYQVTNADNAAKGLVLTVEALDSYGNPVTNTGLVWKSSDTKVAAVSADKTTRVVTIKPGKEQGHATISATAKDARGEVFYFTYEYRNMAPRVDKKALKVNPAYDTDTAEGLSLAAEYGSVLEIIPVYGDSINTCQLYDKTAATWDKQDVKSLSTDFGLTKIAYANNYIVTSTATAKSGKHNLWLVVTTNGTTTEFAYPLTITVAVKKPSVSVKAAGKINLFYIGKNDQEYINVTVGNDVYGGVPTVVWKQDSSSAYGFTVSGTASGPTAKGKTQVLRYAVNYDNVKVDSKGKLAEPGIDKGTVIVTLPGIRKEHGGVTEKAVKIAATYKKPALVTGGASSNIIRDARVYGSSFNIYNKTDKVYLKYFDLEEHVPSALDADRFTGITTTTGGVELSPKDDGYSVSYMYNGSKTSEKLQMTVDNILYWREPLTVTHTIKNIVPKAALSIPTITTNSTLDDLLVGAAMESKWDNDSGNYEFTEVPNLYIYIKGYGGILTFADVQIQGVGPAAGLVDNNFIRVNTQGEKAYLEFNQYAVKALGSLKKGSYKFKLTPFYERADGTLKDTNPVTLTIKVVDQKITAKTSAKGGLDIAKGSFDGYKRSITNGKEQYEQQNVVKIKTNFSNLPTGVRTGSVYNWKDHEDYYDIEPVLKGQYADCFELSNYSGKADGWCIGFKGFSFDHYYKDAKFDYMGNYSYNTKLKAGVTVPLSIDYRIKVMGTDGEPYVAAVVNGGTFKVKITQSKPKVTVKSGNNQVLYAAAGSLTREATLAVSLNSCAIDYAYGSLDCNKDGIADIEVEWDEDANDYRTSANEAYVEISINDPDAVFASSSGTTLSIPVQVVMRGADGVAQYATTTIKVKVKR